MDRLFWIVMAVIGGGLILLVANNDAGAVFGIENDTFASMLYLGVWGGVLAAAIAGSGMRFGHIARNLAVWLFMILCLMAGYQYRYELQDIASRVTAGLIPGSPLSAVGEDGRTVVSLDKRADGHFGVRAVVDGTTVHFLVDTGATGTMLSQAWSAAKLRAVIGPCAVATDSQTGRARPSQASTAAQASSTRPMVSISSRSQPPATRSSAMARCSGSARARTGERSGS